MLHPLKITSTLADETRYLIYEYMLQQKRHFTVQEIADQFSIHPNVARLHLTKLSEIDVITADYLKTGKGGRPGRVYKATKEGITLTFPKREEPLLLNWLLQLVSEMGETALAYAQKISFDDGYTSMKAKLLSKSNGHTLTVEEKATLLTKSATLIGYVPHINEDDTTKTITFSIHSCPFNNQLSTYSEITCTIHESYLKGQVRALYQTADFIQIESMKHNCDFCNYEIKVEK